MIFRRTFVAFSRYAFVILAFLATIPVFGFSASVFADSSSSAVYGDEGSVENSSNFSVTVEELNALELRLSASDLVLDLNPTSDAPVFGSSDLSVTVYTTNTTGYYLTMTPTYQSVATTNLTRTESLSGSYPTISTLTSTASPSTFASVSDSTTTNKWGYKVNTTNLSTVDTTIYNPTIAASIPLNKTNTPINTGDETDITFAAKVDSETPAGSYKVDLNFTAITNANTYSITFNPGSASSDASLANMPSPNPQTGALESGSSTSITLSSSTPTRNGYSFLGWCSVAPTTSNNTDSCSGTTYQPNSSITIYTDTPDITLYAMWGIDSYAITLNGDSGVSNFTVNGSTISKGGSTSLTYGQTYTITINYANGYEAAATPLQKNSGEGTVSGTSFTVGAGIATLYANSKASAVTVTFKSNTASGINLCTSATSCTTYANNATAQLALGSYTVYGAYGSRQGFSSWSTTANGSVGSTSAPATTFTVSGATTLTLNGTTTSTAIQNLSSSSCTSTASLVYDNRDDQTYQIRRLADGNCWMMTNLNLGATDLATDLTSANTNLSDTIAAATFNGWNRTTSGNSYSSTAPKFSPVNGADTTAAAPYGTLYNYCAASAGTICTGSNSNNASYDLCPAGWRLPTSGSGGEFATLYANTSYNTNAKMRKSVANGGAAFALAGSFYSSTPTNQGSYGFYWSSTRNDSSFMYYLNLNTSNVNPSNSNTRSYGFSIRCILDEPTMQDFSSTDFTNMSVGSTTTLKDSRTGTTYEVAMLSLNNTKTLWMMSNLKLPGGTTLTTSDSNVTADYTLPSDTGSSGWKNDFCKPYMAYKNGEYYYNWPAATARTNTTSNTSSCSNDTSNSVGDICPKGWRLPVYSGEVDNSTWRSDLQANGSLTTAGNFFGGSQYNVGSYGFWWTSTRRKNDYSWFLRSDGSTATANDGNKSSGDSVRCMRTS